MQTSHASLDKYKIINYPVRHTNIMYCVYKETDLYIDMTLWSLLERKVIDLGKIMDGTK